MGGLYREGLLVSAEYKTKEETGRGQEYLKMYQRPGDDAGCRATEEEEEEEKKKKKKKKKKKTSSKDKL